MFERSLLAAAILALLPATAGAQDWRDVTSFRQHSDESALRVHVRYGAGELMLLPGSAGELYRLALRYDADAFDPVAEYRNGRLEVGVEGAGRGVRLKNTQSGELRLALTPDVPLDLDLEFGAVEATLDLSGLSLERVAVETGASDTELMFRRPNPVECRELSITMGAAAFEAKGLGHANCRTVTVEGGVGDVTLDFSGEWRRDITADVTIALGSVTLLIPENVGVSVDKDTFLADFNASRFYRSGDMRYSDNWDTAERRLTVRLEGAFGSIDVRWITPSVTTP